MTYTIEITEEAMASLEEISDGRVRRKLLDRIGKLEVEPEKQGKPLRDVLAGYLSVRAVGQRYRIIYEIHADVVIVVIVGVGIRKDGHRTDVYAKTTKLMLRKE
jgi:mRNA interferase RelE/StbE